MYSKKIFFNILFIFAFFYANSQTTNFKFRHLTIKEGLTHNNVYTIMQDSKGFVWIGTQNGLDKYSGYDFLSYYYSADDSCSLISPNFGKLFEDSQKRIWIGTYKGGISLYNPDKDEVVRFLSNENDSTTIPSNFIRGIVEDENRTIWIGTADNGLCKYNEKSKNFTIIGKNRIIDESIRDMKTDNYGNIWIATINGLSCYNIKDDKFTNYLFDDNNLNASISDNNLQSLYCDKNGNVWIGTRNSGLSIYDSKAKKFTHYKPSETTTNSISGKRIQSIFEDSYGGIWIGTYNNGVNLFDKETKTFKVFKNSKNEENSLSHNRIEVITEDKAGNLWIGTRGGGINILDLKPQKFNNITNKNQPDLPEGSIRAIVAENDNIIWFGTERGLCRYDNKKDKFIVLKEEEDNPNSISNNRVRSIMIDDKQNIWAGTYSGGLNKIEQKNGEFKITIFRTNEENPETIISDQINYVFQDSKKNIWIGTTGGMDKLTFNENDEPKFEHFYSVEEDESSLSNRYVTSIYEDQNGNIWIGTSNGLNKYIPEKNNFKRYWNSTTNINKGEVNAINVMTFEKNGNIWIGTDGSGFYMFEPKTGKYNKFIDPTFKTNNVSSIIEDKQQNLWIGSAKGISKFNTKTLQFIHYGISDGLDETGFVRNAASITPSGNIYFGNISGITFVQPEKIELNTHIPTVVLTEFKIFNTSFFQNKNSFCAKSPTNLKEINLSYKDNVVSFEFTSLDFTDPTKNNYIYKMEGFNNDWIELGTRGYVMFTSLPPGKYTLKVKGTNNDGIWSDDKTSLSIKINVKPPFWQTAWFYALVISTLVFLVYFFIRRRLKKLREEKDILEQKVRQRTEEVESQKEELLQQAEALEDNNAELEKLSIVASETDNAVTIIDIEGNVEWVNAGFTKLYGWASLEDFIANKGNILEGDFNDETKNAFRKCVETKKTVLSKNVAEGKKFETVWIQTTWSPILSELNELLKVIAVDSDVSELKKAEIEIHAQKDILEEQNEHIKSQNEHIKSSIRYAKTIQGAILPADSKFKKFTDFFILYRPKDIVSGDFYWYHETEDYQFITVADCTGHGVPGAFMSMIGTRLFDGIVAERKTHEPAEILEKLSVEIIESLSQNESNNRDGMDLALIRVEKNKEKNIEIVFEGAKRELIYYEANTKQLKRIKGSRKRIGGVTKLATVAIFENKKIYLNKGDVIYLSTDGYIDQCNVDRKRIGTKALVNRLEQIANEPMTKQKEILEKDLDDWQKETKQRDDIAIVGIKL